MLGQISVSTAHLLFMHSTKSSLDFFVYSSSILNLNSKYVTLQCDSVNLNKMYAEEQGFIAPEADTKVNFHNIQVRIRLLTFNRLHDD